MPKITINSINELKQFVDNLLKKGYKKFLLEGDLGVGKTEFTKQLAKKLGIKNISSPTYTYINIYENKLLHGDFYRIETEQDFINLGILDELENYDYISIEWPKFDNLYNDGDFIKIKIEKNNNNQRIIYY